jgi:hypothetical protein
MEQNGPKEADSRLIFVSSSSIGEDSKGRQKVDLRFNEEETQAVLEELTKIKEAGKRLKLQVHIGEQTAFMFVKEVMSRQEAAAKKQAAVSAGVSAPGAAKQSKIAALAAKT